MHQIETKRDSGGVLVNNYGEPETIMEEKKKKKFKLPKKILEITPNGVRDLKLPSEMRLDAGTIKSSAFSGIDKVQKEALTRWHKHEQRYADP